MSCSDMFTKIALWTVLAGVLSPGEAVAETARIARVKSAPANLHSLPMSIGGRVLTRHAGDGAIHHYQWPGTYFEAAFQGNTVYFDVGPGETILHVLIEGQPPYPLIKPA